MCRGLFVDTSSSPPTVYAATYGGDGRRSFHLDEWRASRIHVNYTTANGLGSNNVLGVYVAGSTIYAATDAGLAISTNGGTSFTNYTTANGLGSNFVFNIFVSGSTIYAATSGLGRARAAVFPFRRTAVARSPITRQPTALRAITCRLFP